MWNLILDLEALKENSVPFLLTTVWWLDVLKGTEEIIWKRLSNKWIKKSRLKFITRLALIGLKQPGTALSIGRYSVTLSLTHLSYANDVCMFCSNKCVINVSVKMLKTNLLTSSMQMTKKNSGLEFCFCLLC